MKRFIIIGLSLLVSLTGCSNTTTAKLDEMYNNGGMAEVVAYYDESKDNLNKQQSDEVLLYIGGKTTQDNLLDIDVGIDVKETEVQDKYLLKRDDERKLELLSFEVSSDKIDIRVKNNTDKTVTYFKYDIYYFDVDGNIIDSDWSNCSKPIVSGAEASTSTYIDQPEGSDKVGIDISEISYK